MAINDPEWQKDFSMCLNAWEASISNNNKHTVTTRACSENTIEEFINTVPKPLHELVDNLVNNNRRFEHLINFVTYEIVSAALETGGCSENSPNIGRVKEALNKTDKTLMGAVVGYKLYERYRKNCEANHESLKDVPTIDLPQEGILNMQSSKEESSNLPSLRVSKESSWTYAHGLINMKDSEVNNAVKIAKVFFDEIMTPQEVINGSMRSQYIGEGCKRRKTQVFDHEKLNFIRDACAFILSTQDRKKMGTVQFEEARNNPSFKTLSDETWLGLKMPVFSKHASLQRRKYEDIEETNIAIRNVKSLAEKP